VGQLTVSGKGMILGLSLGAIWPQLQFKTLPPLGYFFFGIRYVRYRQVHIALTLNPSPKMGEGLLALRCDHLL